VDDVRVAGGSGAVTVSWAAPPDARDVSFEVTAVPEDRGLKASRCSTRALSCVVKGLTNGAGYTIEVRVRSTDGAMSAPQRAHMVPRPDILTSKTSVLWLDADDVATVVSSSPGGPVSQWRDKSGRGNSAAQPTAATRPSTGITGKRRALKFNGTQGMIVDGRRLPSESTPSLVLVAARLDDPLAASSCFAHVLAWGSGEPGAARIIHKGCGEASAYGETYGTYTAMKPRKAWPVGRMALLSVEFTKSRVDVRMNGAPDYSWTAPADLQTRTLPQPDARIGSAAWAPNAGWKGLIGEVIILAGNVDPADRDQVERYLIRKWSIS
jgi:hypothetical protein